MIKCPICELNYMQETEEMCEICKKDHGLISNMHAAQNAITGPQSPRYNGIALFYVFQNETMFANESAAKFIWAPFESNGKDPHHWQRLENVKKGDLIFHGVGGYIRAISVVASKCYQDKNIYQAGLESGRKVDCEYVHLLRPLYTQNYKREIITYCANKLYQPFNKNGTGNQGYLFDIDRQLATIFINEICKYNPNVKQLVPIKTLL